MSTYYNADYFAWQKEIGKFGAWANKPKFSDYVQRDDRVLDYGCGGGYLLEQLNCAECLGLEPNVEARKEAALRKIPVVSSLEEIPDGWADVVISNHALEHVPHPLLELQRLNTKLRDGGRLIFVVPADGIAQKFTGPDRNQHLYTWNAVCLANLFRAAGFEVRESKPYIHRWPPGYRHLSKLGRRVFDFCCIAYGFVSLLDSGQVRLIATKPTSANDRLSPDWTARSSHRGDSL